MKLSSCELPEDQNYEDQNYDDWTRVKDTGLVEFVEKMWKYEMDPASIVEDTADTIMSTDEWTDR